MVKTVLAIMKKKLVILFISLVILAGTGIWYYVFQYSKTHHRKVTDETAIVVSANAIVKEFQLNEVAANAKYLNKAVQVIGEVKEIKTDQAGNTTVTLKTDDVLAGVFCTLTSGSVPQSKTGTTLSIKGICNGFLSDVVLNGAIPVK